MADSDGGLATRLRAVLAQLHDKTYCHHEHDACDVGACAAALALKDITPDACAALDRAACILKNALGASGCDGDLCMHEWHEDARRALAYMGMR